MSVRIATLGLTVVVGVMLVSLSGCSKKSIQSGRRYPGGRAGDGEVRFIGTHPTQ